jgi:hypothetical protein
MLPWGRQGRSLLDLSPSIRVQWPEEPWVRLDVIKSGAWANLDPKPVRIAVSRFMIYRVLGAATIDQWITLKPREYLQGALLEDRAEHAVYIVTVDPPEGYCVASPWPRVVSSRREQRTAAPQ